ncbi:MAG: hypothetical protein QM692_15805 [Thermomicrobiales bacterium]
MTNQPLLTATPNPAPHAGSPGSTTISWSTGDGQKGLVAVSEDGGKMRPFAEGRSGTETVEWIAPGRRYTFTLFGLRGEGAVLAMLEVAMEGSPAAGPEKIGGSFIRANPNPVPYSAEPGSVVIEWSTGYADGGRVTVATDGGSPAEFATGAAGSAAAPWIAAGRRYVFALHAGEPTGRPLASVEVGMNAPIPITGAAPERPFLAASPNPIPLQPGVELGTTIISWSTAQRGPGLVTVRVPGNEETPFHGGPEGHAEAGWIKPGVVYLFRLYSGPDQREQLGAITVTMASAMRERVLDIAVLAGAGAVVASAVAIPISLAVRIARKMRQG